MELLDRLSNYNSERRQQAGTLSDSEFGTLQHLRPSGPHETSPNESSHDSSPIRNSEERADLRRLQETRRIRFTVPTAGPTTSVSQQLCFADAPKKDTLANLHEDQVNERRSQQIGEVVRRQRYKTQGSGERSKG